MSTTTPRATPAVRHDPLRNFQFRVKMVQGASSDEYVAGVQKVSGLNLSISASETWSGGNSLHRYANPDKVTWDPITLEQGMALDDSLAQWAEAVLHFVKTAERPQAPLKRDLIIDVWDPHKAMAGGNGERSERVRRFMIFNAWISRYQALPQLDAMGNEVALVTVELVHEGWRVDTDEYPPSDIVNFGNGAASGEGTA
jgi:phage tail-like protein